MEENLASDKYPPRLSNERRFPWGCLLGGCLGVLLLIVGGTVATGWLGYSFYKGQLTKYTSEKAEVLPTVELSQEEIEAIEKRVDAFQEELDEGKTPEQLVLTAEDLNALISNNEDLRGKVFVKIEKGEITADVSYPTDALPGGKGRFFNGSVTAEVELSNGVLIVTVSEAEVNGNPVPEEFMQGLRKENLAKDLYKDPEVAKKLARFESIVVDDDRIILTVDEENATETHSGELQSERDDMPVESTPGQPTIESSPEPATSSQGGDVGTDPTIQE